MEKQPVRLSVGKMELPMGVFHACYVDDEMREVIQYEVNTDTFRVRWDTIIDGWQYTVSKWDKRFYGEKRAIDFAKSERDSTRRLLIDLRATGVEMEAKMVQAEHLR
jgi:hypothetical protein